MKILAVDDDSELRPLIAFSLRQAGYLVIEASTGERALELLSQERPDLVVLDVNLPGIDGFEVCRRLRRGRVGIPVLMLTVRGDEEDEVQGLDCGADDYLTKPFSPRTLLARIRALLRRTGLEQALRGVTGDLELDPETQTARIAGKVTLRLTALELRLLQFLAAHAGQPVLSDRLLLHVWGSYGAWERQRLKQLVHRLRQTREDDPSTPRCLITISGVGYQLAVGPSEGQLESSNG
jgi:DNA-binding response OmpR family regulator